MKNKQRQELAVCGRAAVCSLGEYNSQKIERLYFTKERAVLLGGLCKVLAARKIPYNQVESADELVRLCGSVHHQGLVAMIQMPVLERLTKEIVDQWIAEREKVLILDRIGNANNLGALIRSAAFFGIKNIVLPENEAQASISTSTYRSAQGGMELVSLYKLTALDRLLNDVRGKMLRIGTDSRAPIEIKNISRICAEKKQGIFLILGNEENGISFEIKTLCDYLMRISPAAANSKLPMDSLNVAQAAAVILYEMSSLN